MRTPMIRRQGGSLALAVVMFVAVPAVWAYNIFTNKVEAFSIEMTNSSSELIDYFIKQKGNKR